MHVNCARKQDPKPFLASVLVSFVRFDSFTANKQSHPAFVMLIPCTLGNVGALPSLSDVPGTTSSQAQKT